jgi:TolB-like protein/Flp pilus assembly protein TadD
VNDVGLSDVLVFKRFRLDCQAGVLYRLDQDEVGVPVELGSRAVRVLITLAARAGQVVSKNDIMKAVWPGRVVEDANLNTQVAKLRQILDQDRSEGSCIQTISGRGYCFVAPVTSLETTAKAAAPSSFELTYPDQRLSIVVLPFENLSSDPGEQYFADGITEDLTTNLSRFAEMLVISRNTAFTYRDKLVSTKLIGRELGVRYVVQGSVRRFETRVRVAAQLIDAEADVNVWAERFDRELSNLLELQDDVTAAIASAIEPELLRAERNRVASRTLQTGSAYDLYQRGLWHLYRYTRESSVEAEVLFRRALAADPQYPQAAAFLAITVCNAAYLGWADNTGKNYEEAYDLAQRAVDLDPRYPSAHFALGLVCMWTRRSERAMSSLQEAINLNPSFAAAYVLLGQMHLYHGDPQGAIALAEKGIRLSPKDPRLFMWLPAIAGAHYQLKHYEEAVDLGRRSWLLNRNWPAGLRYVVAGLAHLGRLEEANAALADLKLLNHNLTLIERNLRRLYRDQAAVEHILDGLRAAGLE